jgi:sulfoxide reductase heme-binding subunit YedZ
MAFAYVGMAFLCTSLVIGPWKVLRGSPLGVSTDFRRDVGIWAGLLGLTHVFFGVQVHMGGKLRLYFLSPPDSPSRFFFRTDPFGFANYTGLGATLVLLLLLGLSNEYSLRLLRPTRWKALQRWNYAGFALIAVHGGVYQVLEKRPLPFVSAFAILVVTVVALQLAGFSQRRAALKGHRRVGRGDGEHGT